MIQETRQTKIADNKDSPANVSIDPELVREWIEFLESAEISVHDRNPVAQSFAKAHLTVNMASRFYTDDALAFEQDIITHLQPIPQLAENPLAIYNVKKGILLKFKQSVPYLRRNAPQNKVSTSINIEMQQELVPLIDVLCDIKCRSSEFLGKEEVEFIVAPQELVLMSTSIEQFAGMMIRPAYKKLAASILERLNSVETYSCVLVCGTTGIGKSMFGIYCIYLFINSRGDDVMWKGLTHLIYDNGGEHVFLFERGNHEFKCELRQMVKKQVVATGVKSSIQLADGFPFISTAHSIGNNLVFISSPNILNKAKLPRNTPRRTFYMPVWSLDELELCNKVMKIVDPELVPQLYYHFGGSARHVLFSGSNEDAVKQIKTLDHKIISYDPKQLVDYVLNNDLSSDVSYSLIHYHATDDLTDRVYLFASEYIQKKVMKVLFKQQKDRLVNFLRASAGNSVYHQLRGRVFEDVAHEYFLSRISGEVFTIKSLDNKESIQIPMPTQKYQFAKKNVESFIAKDKESAKTCYFAPTDEKFGTIDSFIPPNVFLQMTVSTSHGLRITDDLVNIVDIMQTHYPDVESCLFVWVIPADISDQFGSKSNITFEEKATNEKKVVAMIKQYKMEISIDDDLWKRITADL